LREAHGELADEVIVVPAENRVRLHGDVAMQIAGGCAVVARFAFAGDANGLAFMHAGGTIIKKDLQPGETLMLDTGCLVAMSGSVNYDIRFAGNVKTALFGGEGLTLATLTGPGTIWLQSLPFSRLADRIYAAGKGGSARGREEGSILGNIGIGNFFGGNG
jgi:uncharacterized protein (AIM24 family)